MRPMVIDKNFKKKRLNWKSNKKNDYCAAMIQIIYQYKTLCIKSKQILLTGSIIRAIYKANDPSIY